MTDWRVTTSPITDPMLAILASIDTTLKALLALAEQRRAAAPAATPARSGPVDDSDLDTPDADELVKMKPRDWTGEDFKGTRMSLCPPAFLEALAEVYDFFATRNDAQQLTDAKGRPKSFYDRRTAARARAWARRLRARDTTVPVSADEVAWGRNW